MRKCFIIQPFDDGGRFDKRYDDVFRPAIENANFEAYRVDRDPSTSIPIKDIESGIRTSDVCFAEITTNNPNVWYELGFAYASRKPVVMACSRERDGQFPFDVRHRKIVRYSTDSPSDFERARDDITQALTGSLVRFEQMTHAQSTDGLSQMELALLVSAAQSVDIDGDSVAVDYVRREMENAGFTPIATTLALRSLRQRRFIEVQQEQGFGFDDDRPWKSIAVLDEAMEWLAKNEDKLTLKVPAQPRKETVLRDDDIPF